MGCIDVLIHIQQTAVQIQIPPSVQTVMQTPYLMKAYIENCSLVSYIYSCMHNYVYVHIDSVSPLDTEAADMDSTIDTRKKLHIHTLLSLHTCY